MSWSRKKTDILFDSNQAIAENHILSTSKQKNISSNIDKYSNQDTKKIDIFIY